MPCRSRFSLPGIASENAFHCESRRLITFEKWEITHPVSPVKLAQDGFFFTEIDDVVACNFCRLFASASRIAPGIVRAFHSEHSPGCPVVTQTDLLNIPLPNYGLAYPNCALHNVQETNANWDMDVNDIVGVWGPNLRIRRRAFNLQRAPVTRGLYPKYAPIDVRRNTFAFFPNGHLDVRCIECLAESGFFCIGDGDATVCFSCGLNLHYWRPTDDPVIAHARWNPQCEYLRHMFGSSFINTVQAEMQIIGHVAV